MKSYDFTLNFALGGADEDAETCLGRLMEAGCDDALAGIGKRGRIALAFSREADTAEQAVLSALCDVRRAIPDARFVEAEPDFVGVPDIANVLGVSRQYVGKILDQHGRDFPEPAHAGTRAIWHLETVLSWLAERKMREIDEALIDVSRVNMRCNFARQQCSLGGGLPDRYLEAVGWLR